MVGPPGHRTHPALLRPGVRRLRTSTWDRGGGNADFLRLEPGVTRVLAEGAGPGQVTHLWFTVATPDLWWGRSLVLRAYWDGESTPSVEAPLGDLLGSGNCLTSTYASAMFEAAPRDGLSLHSWFAMPFSDGFRITISNDGPLPVFALYAYVDHESWPVPDPGLARFHAWWHRERRTAPPAAAGTYTPGTNLTGDENYLLLNTEGRGHYIGASLYVYSDDGGWYGEGDDMMFVDGQTWPPTVHGTGTEDYFGTAWSPATVFSHPYFGQPVAEREDWAGFSSLYRLHVHDPVPFEQSLRVTLEHGHANDRADDWSSVAYWYQLGRSTPLPALPPMSERQPPWPAAWRSRVEAITEVYTAALGEADPARMARLRTGIGYLTRAAHRGAWEDIDRALEWLTGRPTPTRVEPPVGHGPLAALAAADDDEIQRWVASRTAEQVLDAVARDWAARLDSVEARAAHLQIALRLTPDQDAPLQRLTIASGRCTVTDDTTGSQRLTLVADPLTLVRWSLGRLDPWEAVLRGWLVVLGDSDLALRLPALFPTYEV